MASRRCALSTTLLFTLAKRHITEHMHLEKLRRLLYFGQNIRIDVLLHIEGEEWQVQHQRQPVPVDEEEEGQEGVNSGFRNDICVKTVAEIDGVDVVTARSASAFTLGNIPHPSLSGSGGTASHSASSPSHRDTKDSASVEEIENIPLQIAIHDSEEDLQEQVHGIYQHR